jgi:hypothetical protein
MQLLQVPGRGQVGRCTPDPIIRRSYWYFITNMKHDVLCTSGTGYVFADVSVLALFSKFKHMMVPASFSDGGGSFIPCTSFELDCG